MDVGNGNSEWPGNVTSAAEARAQRTLQAAERLLAPPAPDTPDTPVSAEHQLREYMQEMSRTRYGHAGTLISELYSK